MDDVDRYKQAIRLIDIWLSFSALMLVRKGSFNKVGKIDLFDNAMKI